MQALQYRTSVLVVHVRKTTMLLTRQLSAFKELIFKRNVDLPLCTFRGVVFATLTISVQSDKISKDLQTVNVISCHRAKYYSLLKSE